jgi:isopentenyl-diphosphate delta-isomerase
VGGGLTEHEVVDVYVAQAPDALPVTANPEEVMAFEWVRFSDLVRDTQARPERYTPWLRIYLADHATTIFGDMAILQTS